MDAATDEDVVRELMDAKEKMSSMDYDDLGHSSVTKMAMGLSLAELQGKFTQAEHFVSVVGSRLERDPISLDPCLWEFHNYMNKLWALKQQGTVGSCDESRGSKEYANAVAEQGGTQPKGGGFVTWRPCCLRMVGDSKLKLWQNLGEMSKQEAQARYIGIVTELAPDWSNPLSADSALLCTWTPDEDSLHCTICEESFTFLNRRHHCRRCLNLVCAVCSPHHVPLRVFSQTAKTPQRICNKCFLEIVGQNPSLPSLTTYTDESDHHPLSSTLHNGSSKPTAYPFPLVDEDEDDDTTNEPIVPPPSLLETSVSKSPVFLSTTIASTIHCGKLDFLHGAGFRKNWNTYFFVLLIRKGSLGMFLNETDHIEKKKRPAAVHKLSGYSIRVKSQKRRPHQFRLSHMSKKPLHFAATSIEEMNVWISHLSTAIENANGLEATNGEESVEKPVMKNVQKSPHKNPKRSNTSRSQEEQEDEEIEV